MDDSLNPYASPQAPPERIEQHDPRVVQGWFEVSEQLQRENAQSLRRWQKGYQAWCVVPIVIAFLGTQVASALNLPEVMLACLVLIPITALFGVALAWWLKSRAIERNFVYQSQHPVVGSLGLWQLTMDLNTVTLHTPGGSQTWPAETARYTAFPKKPIMIWLEPDLVVALPFHGDYGHDSYASLAQTVCQRVKHANFK